MTRAQKGGETGINGEHYAGGQYLPNTTLPKGTTRSSKPRRPARVEIEPYTYAEAPAGMTSIYTQIAGVFGTIVNGAMIINCSDATLRYFNRTRTEVNNLAERWNNGERWTQINR